MRVSAAAETDPGRRRKNNDDFVLLRADLGLYVVADGVGGGRAGDVASRLASLSIANFFEATQGNGQPDAYGGEADQGLHEHARRLSAAIRKANADVYTIASTAAGHEKMTTTVVAAFVSESIHIGHVGDSRCYLVRDNRIEQLTRDHTLRNQARDERPDLDEERIAQIPANMLYRAVGRSDEVEIAVCSVDPKAGDRFLLCSDGMNKMVSDQRMHDVMAAAESPEEACQLLVDLANEAGGRDNVTALVIWFT